MTKQPTEPLERATKQIDDDGITGVEDGDLETGNWNSIGFLAERILSRAKAKKETGEANAAASPVSFAQASLGGQEDVASKPMDSTNVDACVERRESALQQYI